MRFTVMEYALSRTSARSQLGDLDNCWLRQHFSPMLFIVETISADGDNDALTSDDNRQATDQAIVT